jgi:hypothetical protein
VLGRRESVSTERGSFVEKAALSVGIVDSFAEQISGIRYTVPWSTLGVIVGLAYFAPRCSPPSFLPARPPGSILPKRCVTSREGPILREGTRGPSLSYSGPSIVASTG